MTFDLALLVPAVIAIVIGWLIAKVVGFALKLTLWCVLAGVAYFFFAQVFGWPLPAGRAGGRAGSIVFPARPVNCRWLGCRRGRAFSSPERETEPRHRPWMTLAMQRPISITPSFHNALAHNGPGPQHPDPERPWPAALTSAHAQRLRPFP